MRPPARAAALLLGLAAMAAMPQAQTLRDPHAYSGGESNDAGAFATHAAHAEHMLDAAPSGLLLAERLERVIGAGARAANQYDLTAWWGNALERAVIKIEGEQHADTNNAEARNEWLWRHALGAFWNRELGVRLDSGGAQSRVWAALGLEGGAPYGFGMEATLYLGESNRAAARLALLQDWVLTRSWVLQARLEANAYSQSDATNGLGSGLSDAAAGLRWRYEFTRRAALYLGWEHSEVFGDTANAARAAGRETLSENWLAGLRLWFAQGR